MATVTQYGYRNKHSQWKLKTVFESLRAGNAVLNKALIDGIKAQRALTAGEWEYRAAVGAHHVTVRFNGTALQHIT